MKWFLSKLWEKRAWMLMAILYIGLILFFPSGTIVTSIIFFALTFVLQYMGSKGILFLMPPANHYGLVIAKGDSKEIKKLGGRIIKVAHAVPGKKIQDKSADQMKWFFVRGDEPRDWLFLLLGIIWIGPYQTLRKNTIRSFRYGRKTGEENYHLMPKDEEEATWIPYSGQQDLEILDIETKDVLGVNLKINLLKEDKFPVRARLVVADSNAVLSIMTSEEVIGVVGDEKLEKVVSGHRRVKDKISSKIQGIAPEVVRKVGINITSVDIFDASMTPETKALVELQAKTERENKAEIAKAEKDKQVKILGSEAQKFHNENVIIPLAEAGELAVRVREAEAYENNETVTTSVRGSAGVMVGTK